MGVDRGAAWIDVYFDGAVVIGSHDARVLRAIAIDHLGGRKMEAIAIAQRNYRELRM